MTRHRPSIVLATASAASAASFALLATAVAGRKTSRVDRALRPMLKLRKGHPARTAADRMAPLGKWWTYVPTSAAVAAYLVITARTEPAARRRRAGAAAVVASGILAFGAAKAMDRVLPQPPAPPGHRARRKPVFPSGHAMGTGTVSMTTAYVLASEGLMQRWTAAAMAFGVPLVSTGGKVLEEKHWGSDALGGLLAAVMLSSACLAAYELTQETG